jgi:phosphoribosyl 1,2-cyclic phosphodiesterase
LDLDYKVIATGSTGNAVRIGHILIDCGVPYRKLKAELAKVDTLLITHSHGDHLKQATLKQIRVLNPQIKICANYDVAYQYKVDHIFSQKPLVLRDGTVIHAHEGVHDVPVSFFSIEYQGMNIFYATDTNTVFTYQDMKYDYIFCEANYDEELIKLIGRQYRKKGYDPMLSAQRHLSVQKCKAFYYMNRKESGVLIELHQSKRFR